jgi:hypothetical protein
MLPPYNDRRSRQQVERIFGWMLRVDEIFAILPSITTYLVLI